MNLGGVIWASSDLDDFSNKTLCSSGYKLLEKYDCHEENAGKHGNIEIPASKCLTVIYSNFRFTSFT